MGAVKTVVRPATLEDASAIARVHVAAWKTTYAGIVPQAYLDGLDPEARTRRWIANLSEPEQGVSRHTLVAQTAEEGIFGFASGGPNRNDDFAFDGELWAIYLLAACQGQGIGRQLVGAIAARLGTQGHRSMLVWVLRDNPARGFYQALGGKQLGEKTIDIGGVPLPEIAYGWSDLAELLT